MKKLRFVLVLFVLMSFGSAVTVPAEDVPETSYDESEKLPYEASLVYSSVVMLGNAGTTEAMPNYLRNKLRPSSLLSSSDVCVSGSLRSADARLSLALVCTLLC
jgi:hypothetical protein